MYEVVICPESEILSIKCNTLERAKQVTKNYYPNAWFMAITTDNTHIAIYKNFQMSEGMDHIGNIWYITE